MEMNIFVMCKHSMDPLRLLLWLNRSWLDGWMKCLG